MSLPKPYTPQPLTGLQIAFPANVADLMPAMADIPEDFRRQRGDARPWVKFQSRWFFSGLRGLEIIARDGFDRARVIQHLAAIQGSWEPKHEHKMAAVAYLASLWLEPVDLPARPS